MNGRIDDALPSSRIEGMSLKGCDASVTLYLINSNSPSGGMNVIVLSESNLPSRTHLWKVQSSISTPELPPSGPELPPSFSIINLSFKPNLHSGIPVSCVFIITLPWTSARRTDPLDEVNKDTVSWTSICTSLRLYLIPSRLLNEYFGWWLYAIMYVKSRKWSHSHSHSHSHITMHTSIRIHTHTKHTHTYQSIAPVICEVIDPTDASTFLDAAVPRLIYNFKTSVAQFWGYPTCKTK